MPRQLEQYQIIERSLIKKYRKEIWNPFIAGVKRYELVNDGDKIAVCISGGKDSMIMANLMRHLQRISDTKFELVYLCMDPGYKDVNRKRIEDNAKLMNIDLTVYNSDIFDAVNTMDGSPCYMCARMRRGHLYAKAKELGCNKIALGHHFDDVIETTLMGMMYGAQIQGMLPKLHSTNFEGMELIRPLYCVHEDAIIAWKNYNNLEFIQCACRFVENRDASEDGIGESKRQEIKFLIRDLKKINPLVDSNIFNSIHAVNVDTMPGYKMNGKEYSFLDNF
ncbi:MAG: tRNA 2-thiocytidine biosynthesis protein TtcA [Clostridia bacterium]|nr:tRNA 2-thiocytidine biosynthesis protein TtcA [Clostridia bacterium]